MRHAAEAFDPRGKAADRKLNRDCKSGSGVGRIPKRQAALNTATETDHLVIGGGLAGSMAALLLASAGREVTLLERERTPHHKVCDAASPRFQPSPCCVATALASATAVVYMFG